MPVLKHLMAAMLVSLAGLITAAASEAGTDLLLSAENGDLKAVKELLAQGAKVDTQNATNGWTPLFYAAKRGDIEMVTALVSHRADVNARSSTKTGSRAIQFAINSGNLQLVEFLVANGVRLDARAGDGSTPLTFAVSKGQLATVKLFLDHGADPNQYGFRNEQNNVFTPLMIAIVDGNTNMAALLLARGADLEKRNNRGNTVLMEAAKLGDSNVLRWLIGRGAQVSRRSPHGHTAFIYAAYNGNSENLKLLLQAGADPWVQASDAEEPNWGTEYGAERVAREQGHEEALAIVLEAQKRARPSQ